MEAIAMAPSIPLGSLLKHAKKTVDEHILSNPSLQVSPDALCGKLSALICDLSVGLYANSCITLSCEEKEDLWHIINKVWNWCADIATEAASCLTAITQPTSDLLAHAKYAIVFSSTMISHEQLNKLAIYHKVVRLLAQAYLVSSQAAHALACVQNVRKLKDFPDDAPDLCLTATEALIQLDRLEEADAELLALVLHKEASAALCLASLTAVIEAPGCTALKPAADIVLERFVEATVPLRLVQALLGASQNEDISQERAAIVLDIAGNEKVLQLVRKEDDASRDQRKSMYMLLSNCATQRFASKEYKASEDFYTAALGYAEEDAEADVVRQLALAHLAEQDPDRSVESLETEIEDNTSAFTANLQGFEVLLAEKEACKVLDRVQPRLNSDDPSVSFLGVLGPELAQVSNLYVAYRILKTLWKEAIARQGPSKRPGDDADTVGNLIRVVKELNEGYLRAGAREGRITRMLYKELAALFSTADNRLQAVGRGGFFRSGPGVAGAPINFAEGASEAGTGAMSEAEDLLAAATLFKASGSFWKVLPCTTPEHWAVLRTAYVSSIRCTVNEFERRPKSTRKACLHLALTLLEQALPALREAAMQHQIDPEELLSAKEAMWSLEFTVAEGQGKYEQLLPLMERAKTEGLFKVDKLLHLGHACLQKRRKVGTPAAKVAFSAALQLMRSQREPPCMDKLAKTVKNLYELSSEEEILALLADVGAFVRSREMPSYPSNKMTWLFITTWALGAKHAHAQRNAQALALMEAAIDLMDLCDDLRAGKEMFKRGMEQLQKDFGEAATATT